MRKIFIAGNWKMNKNLQETESFFNSFNEKISNQHYENIEILVCPPSPFIYSALNLAQKTQVEVGSQNVSKNRNGAYTGEVSADMLKSLGLKYCIVGHSERRKYHDETSQIINLKLKKLLDKKITPILCIGESEEEREKGLTDDVIVDQLKGALKKIDLKGKSIVIAYEPIWAIGTGKTATPETAEKVHKLIRYWLEDNFSKEIASTTPILYGGSVKPANIEKLLNKKNIDGGLIGGASLDPEKMIKMIEIAQKQN